jgi:hypothetical protein
LVWFWHLGILAAAGDDNAEEDVTSVDSLRAVAVATDDREEVSFHGGHRTPPSAISEAGVNRVEHGEGPGPLDDPAAGGGVAGGSVSPAAAGRAMGSTLTTAAKGATAGRNSSDGGKMPPLCLVSNTAEGQVKFVLFLPLMYIRQAADCTALEKNYPRRFVTLSLHMYTGSAAQLMPSSTLR